MNCVAVLKRMGVLRPYGVDEILAAERDNVVREHAEAVQEHAASSQDVRVVASVASLALRMMQAGTE